MRDHDTSTLRFWGISFLFFGLLVTVLASALHGSSLSSTVGMTGVGVITVIVGSLMTFLSFTLTREGDSSG